MKVLVADGGGMRTAFTAGVLIELHERGLEASYFDLLVGSSGGFCCEAYYATGQVEGGQRIWINHMHGKFMKWNGFKPSNDVEHLESVIREIEPLDCSVLKQSSTKVVVALTDPEKMDLTYLFVKDANDPIDLLIASTAMPFFALPKLYNGAEYYDANIICAIPLRYLNRLDNVGEVWVILTTPFGYRRQAWRWKMASWFVKDKRIKELLSRRAETENQVLEEIEKRTDLFVIRPEKPLPIHWRDSNQNGIKKSIELGREAARKTLAEYKNRQSSQF